MKLAVLHGPNLNLLGTREPQIYGLQTLDNINDSIAQLCTKLGISVSCHQSNLEGELVEWIQKLDVDGFVVNAAAYTHTSIAIRDALIAKDRPFVEVHLSNVYARESFRHESFLRDIAVGIVSGFGVNSYLLGLRAICSHLREDGENGI